MIRIRDLSMVYEDGTAPIRHLDLTVGDGEVVVIIGPSGTGKSTLLRCIDMLNRPTQGRIFFDGEDITADDCDLRSVRRRIGMVFQDFNLFRHMTVLENVMDPQTTLLRRKRQDAYDKAMHLLGQVGLSAKALSMPDELSGGQQQRAAIARTLALDPEVILFDEPTSALDPSMVGEVQSVMKMLARSGRTMIIVTHDMDFARKIADRVVFLHGGAVYEEGPPDEIFLSPKREITRRFVERLSVLTYHIDSQDWDTEEMSDELERYGEKLLIEAGRLSSLMICVEEICINTLARDAEEPDMLVRVEYSETSDVLSLTISYSGERYDCASSSNAIFLDLLKEPTTVVSYGDDEAEDALFSHTVRLCFHWREGSSS